MQESLWSKQKSRGVYPWSFGAVNWIIDGPLCERSLRLVYAACALAVLATGCAAPQRRATAPELSTPVGVWYAVSCAATSSGAIDKTIDRDFAAIARADISTVFVKHCHERQWSSLVESAGRHGLRVVVTDPVAARYLRSGTEAQALFCDDAAMRRSAVAGRFAGTIVDDVTCRRARKLARQARAASPPFPLFVQAADAGSLDLSSFDYVIEPKTAPAGAPGVAGVKWPACRVSTVTCRQHRRDEEATVRSWLAAFHLGLACGQTGGVIFDTYRSLPGHWDGIVRGGESPSPERAAMLRRIADRAQRWCPKLRGMAARELTDVKTDVGDLRVAHLSSGKRSYLLVVNSSPVRFARTTLDIPTPIGQYSVDRAVTVTTDEDTTVGAVFESRQGKLRVKIDLPPGEAELFELF